MNEYTLVIEDQDIDPPYVIELMMRDNGPTPRREETIVFDLEGLPTLRCYVAEVRHWFSDDDEHGSEPRLVSVLVRPEEQSANMNARQTLAGVVGTNQTGAIMQKCRGVVAVMASTEPFL